MWSSTLDVRIWRYLRTVYSMARGYYRNIFHEIVAVGIFEEKLANHFLILNTNVLQFNYRNWWKLA